MRPKELVKRLESGEKFTVPDPSSASDANGLLCDECEFLHPKEYLQKQWKDPHICSKTQKRVKHNGQHPRLPRPEWCPLDI